jgi:hypothetical protein
MRAIIEAAHRWARRFAADGWLPLLLFAAVLAAVLLER